MGTVCLAASGQRKVNPASLSFSFFLFTVLVPCFAYAAATRTDRLKSGHPNAYTVMTHRCHFGARPKCGTPFGLVDRPIPFPQTPRFDACIRCIFSRRCGPGKMFVVPRAGWTSLPPSKEKLLPPDKITYASRRLMIVIKKYLLIPVSSMRRFADICKSARSLLPGYSVNERINR